MFLGAGHIYSYLLTYGVRSFAIAGPSIWNGLSPCHSRSVIVQSRIQKTAVWMTIAALVRLNWRLRNVLTYLLTHSFTQLLTYLLTYLLICTKFIVERKQQSTRRALFRAQTSAQTAHATPFLSIVVIRPYRRQGGYVFVGVSQLVCLFVSKITRKLPGRCSQNSLERWHMGRGGRNR